MKYLVIIPVVGSSEVFSFDSKDDRQLFIDDLENFALPVDYATREIKGPNVIEKIINKFKNKGA